MNAALPDVLLFDLGGVLVDFAGFEELNQYLPEPLDASALRDRWIRDRHVAEFERGDTRSEVFARAMVEDWELSIGPREFLDLFGQWFRGLYPGAEELLARIRCSTPNCTIACLSNSNPVHWQRFHQTAARLFDRAYFSYQLGAVKPEREIFDKVLSALGCAPGAVLFLDDTKLNVECARQYGLQAALVQGLQEVEDHLRSIELIR